MNVQYELQVTPDSMLTINEANNVTGTLTATGSDWSAGIGGDSNEDGGTVTINGGDIKATGGDYGAGIGDGESSK